MVLTYKSRPASVILRDEKMSETNLKRFVLSGRWLEEEDTLFTTYPFFRGRTAISPSRVN